MNYQNQEIPPNLTQSQKKVQENQELLLPSAEKKYSKYFKKITELQAGDIIVSAQCKLCNHPLRAEAESKWELTKGQGGRGSYAMVLKFLNEASDEYGGIKFNYQNISTHLNHHYEQQLKRMWMREYGKTIISAVNYKIGQEEELEALVQANLMKFFELAANPDLDPIKQAEVMTKLSKAVIDIRTNQAKLRGDVDTIDIYKEKFLSIIVNLAKDDTSRQRELMEQLDLVKDELRG